MLLFVVVGIGEKTDIIVSPNCFALLITATLVWFPVVTLLLTISAGLIVAGKLSIIGSRVFVLLVL